MSSESAKKVLILRSCNKDFTSYNKFKYPESGWVEAPNWNPDPTIDCGQGLHGLLWGEGNGDLISVDNTLGQVIEVDESDVVLSSGGGKVRFRGGIVTTFPTVFEAAKYIYEHGGADKAISFMQLTGGYGSTLTGGDRSTLTGGDGSTLTGGDGSMLIFKYWDNRLRIVVGYVGENGIEANKPYRLNDDNVIVPVEKEADHAE